MKNELHFSIYQKIVLVTLAIAVILFQFVDFSSLGYIKDIDMITNSITRFTAGIFLMLVLMGFGRRDLFTFKNLKKSLLIIIPAILISINNFPIIAYLDGRANLTEPFYRVILFLIECLSVGFFEEILFRGILLIILIEKLNHLKNGMFVSVLISSLIFGFLHLVNLFEGASISSTMLQVGYSFLMGMLWAVIYLKTGNLWLVMILHATYNFFGQVMFYLGSVAGRYDNITIGVTTILATLAASHVIVLLRNNKLMVHQENGEENEI